MLSIYPAAQKTRTCVTKKAISWVQRSDYVADNRTRVEAHANADVASLRLFFVNQDLARFIDHVHSELGDPLYVILILVFYQVCYVRLQFESSSASSTLAK